MLSLFALAASPLYSMEKEQSLNKDEQKEFRALLASYRGAFINQQILNTVGDSEDASEMSLRNKFEDSLNTYKQSYPNDSHVKAAFKKLDKFKNKEVPSLLKKLGNLNANNPVTITEQVTYQLPQSQGRILNQEEQEELRALIANYRGSFIHQQVLKATNDTPNKAELRLYRQLEELLDTYKQLHGNDPFVKQAFAELDTFKREEVLNLFKQLTNLKK